MASRGTKDSKGPGSIDLGKSKQQSTAATADGKTPTQEMHRFHGNDDSTGGSSLSKRRGSDSLSIGTPSFTSSNADGNVTSAPSGSENPVLPRTRPSNLSAVASVNAANAAAAGKAMDNPNALGLKRPSPAPTPGAGSKATAVSDEDDGNDDDDNHSDTISDTSAGDQGDDEGDSSKKTLPSNGREDGAATPQPPHNPSAQQYHQQQQQQHHHHHYNNQQHNHSQQSYMNIPAHERGRTHNGHDLELNGVQPMRPRQHQRTSTASSIASSSRKEREYMRPFPTPGMKTPNGRRHQQHGNQNGHGHGAEKDPFDEIKSVEECRLVEANEKKRHWKRWGPYLSERQWVSAVWSQHKCSSF